MERSVVRFAEHGDLGGVLQLYRELRPHDPELQTSAGVGWRATLQKWVGFRGDTERGFVIKPSAGI